MNIEAKNVTKTFGQFTALRDVSLSVRTGKLVALLGPSGSGKTTLLRIIAGLEFPDSGSVLFDGKDIGRRSARERNVGFVFQHYALFRHMTVFENIAFGLTVKPRKQRMPGNKLRARVNELLRLVQLESFAERYPSQLSGGQRQRVALARALAVEPRILLLDEPFGSLDAKVRIELRRWLRRLHDEIHVTSVFVTHDQEEALEVADVVAVLNQGQIEQVGSPEEVYHRPVSPFVYDFLGNVNMFRGRIEGERFYAGESSTSATGSSGNTIVYVRPHSLDIDRIPQKGLHYRAKINHINSAGPIVKVETIAEWGDPVHVEISQERFESLQLKKGDEVFLSPKDMKVFSSRNR